MIANKLSVKYLEEHERESEKGGKLEREEKLVSSIVALWTTWASSSYCVTLILSFGLVGCFDFEVFDQKRGEKSEILQWFFINSVGGEKAIESKLF